MKLKDSKTTMCALSNNKLLNEVVEATKFEYPNVDIIGGKTVLPVMFCNDILLRSIFTNVLRNGCRFAETTVKLTLDKYTGDNVEITIFDDGIGVDENHLTKIFDPFYRLIM